MEKQKRSLSLKGHSPPRLQCNTEQIKTERDHRVTITTQITFNATQSAVRQVMLSILIYWTVYSRSEMGILCGLQNSCLTLTHQTLHTQPRNGEKKKEEKDLH